MSAFATERRFVQSYRQVVTVRGRIEVGSGVASGALVRCLAVPWRSVLYWTSSVGSETESCPACPCGLM